MAHVYFCHYSSEFRMKKELEEAPQPRVQMQVEMLEIGTRKCLTRESVIRLSAPVLTLP